MRADADGLPRIGASASTLGARPGAEQGDIPVEGGMVRPGTGGMSVSPPPPSNLPLYRRPPEHGGTARKLWLYELDADGLPEGLRLRPDPVDPDRHIFIEPVREMNIADYQRALWGTRALWKRV